ncbi:MAG TPA: OmpH family outer membrane protein, partial [Chitinophagaceae bacterium]
VIDSHYILEQVPEYKLAQQKLDSIASGWQKEIDARYQQIDKMYKSYQAEQVMLTQDLKQKREDQLSQMQKEAAALQQQRFGYQGDLFKMREQLVKPVQDKVYNAVQQLAAQQLYDFVLDKAGGITVFYSDPKLDKSEEVLKILQIKK